MVRRLFLNHQRVKGSHRMYKNFLILTFINLFFSFSLAESTNVVPNFDHTSALRDYKRFALVIGNKNYEYRPLTNPIKDAKAMKAFLEARGFKVIYVPDANFVTMKAKKEAFLTHLAEAKKSIAFVYYSGHGTQEISRETRKLTNYLIPIDNKRLKTITRLDNYSLSLNEMLGDMDELNHGLNIVLMDACRDGLPAFTKSATRAILLTLKYWLMPLLISLHTSGL